MAKKISAAIGVDPFRNNTNTKRGSITVKFSAINLVSSDKKEAKADVNTLNLEDYLKLLCR